ncbi:MAG: SPFH domain-containing protein [Halobacteriales archaeon]|tara:strand:+ start:454 stop:1488 length:1035 start_codon:yes stop_codon:yes gene_type:complete
MFDLLPLQIGLLPTIPLLILAIIIVTQMVVIVNAYEKKALTIFGEYRGLLDPGIRFVPPFVSKTYTFDMRTQTLDVPRQEAITRDNSPVRADAVVYIRVMDAKKAFLEVTNYKIAVMNLAQTTLRAVLGDMELDQTLSKRGVINTRIREELDKPTDAWGIRVESVEVREVSPSAEVQNAMEQQTSAERRRRAMILEAQGQRRSEIEIAEGNKKSAIIRAQGEKQSLILQAQGGAISTVLRAKAAEAMGERAIINKALNTIVSVGEGESSTIIIPQELTSLLGRYGKHLSGSDVADTEDTLESLDFNTKTLKLLGLDKLDSILTELDKDLELEPVTKEDMDLPDN